MRVQDLGTLVLEFGDRRVELGVTKQAALLSVLALNAGRRVSAPALAAAAWGADADVSASTLDSQLWRLRNVLEPGRSRSTSSVLVREGGGYRLALAADDVDSLRFERLAVQILRVGSMEDAAAALVETDEALRLWRGRPFEALAGSPDADAVAARFEELRGQLEERRVDALLASGQLEWAIADLEPLIARSPFRERLWVQRMTALAGLGRTEEALSSYQRLRRLLADELGLEPGAELQALQSRILARDAALDRPDRRGGDSDPSAAADPPLRSAVRLPRRGTALVGREVDLARLTALVSAQPLVTLTGAGGSGKTRLAVEVGDALTDLFGDGVWFVDLAAAETADEVVGVVTSTLAVGASPVGDPIGELVRFAAGRRVLIILDNCEHVVEAAAGVVEAVLGAGPGPTVLATSREPLNLDGEIIWSLAPLQTGTVEGKTSPAVQLFSDRARAAAPELELGVEQLRLVGDICHTLDGLPLALELAAAQVRWFSLAEIADRVSRDPTRLARVGRGRGDRRDSLFDSIDWSYRLLPEPDQALHRALSVLPGEFALAAARGVLGSLGGDDVPAQLISLAHRSLLVTAADHRRRSSGFAQLATVRSHAYRQLVAHGEEVVAQRRRDDWVRDLLRRRPAPGRVGEVAWYDEVDASYPVVRATLQRAQVDGDHDLVRLGSDLVWFWYYRSRMIEGRRWLEAVHEASIWAADSLETVLLQLRLAAAQLLGFRVDLARLAIVPLLDRLAAVPETELEAMIERVVGLAMGCWACRETELLSRLNAELRLLARRADTDEARLLTDAVACVARAVGPDPGAEVVAAAEDVVSRAAAMENSQAEWIGCMILTVVLTFGARDPAGGRPWLQRAIDINVPLGDGSGSIYLESFAVNAALRGEFQSACRYFAAATTYRRRSGMGWAIEDTETLIEATRAALGSAEFARLFAEGEQLTLSEVAQSWQPLRKTAQGSDHWYPADPGAQEERQGDASRG